MGARLQRSGQMDKRSYQGMYWSFVQSELWKRHAEQLHHRQEINDSEVSTDTPELVQVPSPEPEQRTTQSMAQRQSIRNREPPARLTYMRPDIQSKVSD